MASNKVNAMIAPDEFFWTVCSFIERLLGRVEDDYLFVDGCWLIKRRLVHIPHPENIQAGKVGEYFEAFWKACEKYRD